MAEKFFAMLWKLALGVFAQIHSSYIEILKVVVNKLLTKVKKILNLNISKTKNDLFLKFCKMIVQPIVVLYEK